MRLLSRALFTIALLAGLAFGSYAFGQKVLASKLFGNKGSKINQNFGETTVPLPATTSASREATNSAIASVEVLPESGGASAPSKPASAPIDPAATIDRSNQSGDDGTARPGAGDVILAPRSDAPRSDSNFPSDASPSRTRRNRSQVSPDTSPTPRPRKRRRRRKPRVTTTPQTGTAIESPARGDYSESPEAVVSQESAPEADPEPRSQRIEPRRESSGDSGDNAPSETPRRRRTRTRVEEPSSPRTRIEPRRETPSRRDESPVPRPEGGDNGGESPVPIPE